MKFRKHVLRTAVLIVSLVLVAGIGSSTDLQNIGTITPEGDTVTIDGHLNLSGNSLKDVQDSDTFLSRDGDYMRDYLSMGGHEIINIDWSNSDDGPDSGLDADRIDGVELTNIDWADTAMATGDVAASDVGLGNVENIALSTATWTDMGISRSDVAASDVGLGNVENIALSNAGWTDMGINQQDLSSVVGNGGSLSSGQTIDASSGGFILPTSPP